MVKPTDLVSGGVLDRLVGQYVAFHQSMLRILQSH